MYDHVIRLTERSIKPKDIPQSKIQLFQATYYLQ